MPLICRILGAVRSLQKRRQRGDRARLRAERRSRAEATERLGASLVNPLYLHLLLDKNGRLIAARARAAHQIHWSRRARSLQRS